MCSPASVKMRVIPSFCAMTPERMCVSSRRVYRKLQPNGLELDFHVHTSSKIELHKGINRLRGGVHDIENTLVSAHLELLARLLVDVRRAKHRKALDARRQRDGPANLSAGPLRGRHDFPCRSVEDPMVERLKANTNVLTVHGLSIQRWKRPSRNPAAVQRSSELIDDGGDDAGADGAAA